MQIRIIGAVLLTNGSRSEQKSSVTFRMQKNLFFLYFLCFNKLNLKAKKLYFILQLLFQSAQHYYEKKGKDPGPAPDLYLWLTDPDVDPGGHKTYGSRTLL
jgi:hypothetical protein